ncbi:unnamed protein product [Pleuronectes platessa]|uniref:Uncharacterized protein n=1 Tax=Pleuronectes platessa TaxID=8262 RepID=A0A9N7VDZ3_PLEPL|nr:unnamed protein product [Pleuronectes platessa]
MRRLTGGNRALAHSHACDTAERGTLALLRSPEQEEETAAAAEVHSSTSEITSHNKRRTPVCSVGREVFMRNEETVKMCDARLTVVWSSSTCLDGHFCPFLLESASPVTD